MAAALCFTALGAEDAHAANVETAAADDAAPATRFYLVRAGDTLSDIADAHGLDWRDLARLNRIANPDRLDIGKMLVLVQPGPSASREHVVRPGETLSGIAAGLGMDWRALARLNGLADPDRLAVGQVLKVQAEGDDLLRSTRTAEAREKFARKYGVALPETPTAAPRPSVVHESPAPPANLTRPSPAAFATRADVVRPVTPVDVPTATLRPIPIRSLAGDTAGVQKLGRTREALTAFASRYGVDRPDDASEAMATAETVSPAPTSAAAPAPAPTTSPLPASLESRDALGATASLPAASRSAPASEATLQTVSRIVTPPGRKPAEAQLRSRLPVVASGRPMAPVAATVTLSEVISLSPADLATSLATVLNDETLERLRALGSDQTPVDQVRALGLNITLDTGTISLALDLPPTLRRKTVLGGTDSTPPSDTSTVKPARFATGATGALLLSGDASGDGGTSGQFAVAGFVNVGGLRGVNLDYSGAYQFSGDSRAFNRGPIVAFMDRPEKALRYSVGDLAPQSSSLAASAPILGFSMERSYQRLQPSRVTRPMGSRSIFLERPATIEVVSNGVLIKRFQAEAGPVDLRDLPLAGTSNDVSVFVEDAFGRRELDSFTLANDISLLARGLDEFNVSVGVLREATGGPYQYTSKPVATGFYTRGVTNQLTVSGSFALSDAVKAGSAAAAFPALGGVARVEAGYSAAADIGNGYAVGLAFRSDQVLGGAVSDNLIVRANLTSENYATLYDPSSTDRIKMDAGVDYQIALSRATSVNLGAVFLSRHGASGDDRFLTAGVTRAFGGLQVSLRGRFGENNKGEREQSAFITLSKSFGVRNRASVSYDTTAERTRAEFVRSRRVDVPDVAYRLAAEDSPNGRTVTGSAGYYGARFEVDAGIEHDVGASGGSGAQRYTARLQSGIAYADGVVAFGGNPARGFYLVRAHPSLGKARIEIEEGRTGGPTSARGSGRWPAVGRVGTPYRQTDLSVAVLDAPMGYDVGDTRFAVMPGARSGFVLDVGSDNFRTRTATLMFDDLPVSLVFGHLVNIETGEEKTFFTNKAGRASFSNLAQGRYRVTVNGIDGIYEFSLARDSAVLEDLGTISLERK